ncbi:MAG: BrnT family toxin [candidate division NC10 bacterium]|nr:BrnT family toxin [candidate division NC10 bacterium]
MSIRHLPSSPPPKPFPIQGGGDRSYRPRHLEDENRYVLLGQPERQRLLAVMFTERGEAIRLISARNATHRERRYHEKSKS